MAQTKLSRSRPGAAAAAPQEPAVDVGRAAGRPAGRASARTGAGAVGAAGVAASALAGLAATATGPAAHNAEAKTEGEGTGSLFNSESSRRAIEARTSTEYIQDDRSRRRRIGRDWNNLGTRLRQYTARTGVSYLVIASGPGHLRYMATGPDGRMGAHFNFGDPALQEFLREQAGEGHLPAALAAAQQAQQRRHLPAMAESLVALATTVQQAIAERGAGSRAGDENGGDEGSASDNDEEDAGQPPAWSQQ